MVIVFDLDDTVCETDKYSEQYILDYFKSNNLPYKKIADDTRFAEKKFDWDTETALAWYKEHGDLMMANFPCKENAIETINKLYDYGHTIVIATARSTDWHTNPEEITLKWLKDNNIKYNKAYIGRCDKEAICKEVDADFFVDDDIKTTQRVADYFKSCNSSIKKAFLMNSKFNINFETNDDIIRINNFNDLILNLNKLSSNSVFSKKR